MSPSSFYHQIYTLVLRIPAGKVTSYGRIAAMLGEPSRARQVGYAMSALRYKTGDPAYADLPSLRVVTAQANCRIRGTRPPITASPLHGGPPGLRSRCHRPRTRGPCPMGSLQDRHRSRAGSPCGTR